ncbi:uncharacterized protein VTP21DRAFT_11499 [Calcarisporiella thermophila]|uniref:uncharacterized protein n=1 Tax=Calcarisporiella thermophila TaxID=911321 RepID=UPI003742A019
MNVMNPSDSSKLIDYLQQNLEFIPFKSLREHEVELTSNEKLEQMGDILHRDPGLFLERWGRYLPREELSRFECMRDNYEVNFHLNSLASPPSTSPKKSSLSRNRRLAYLQHLRRTEYFSDEEMRYRQPSLYNDFIGRHVPPLSAFPMEMGLVDRIYSNIDSAEAEERRKWQEEAEEEVEEEVEEEEEEEDAAKEYGVMLDEDGMDLSKESGREFAEEEKELTAEERDDLRREFVRIMEENFLDGKDEFDYDAIDNDPSLDDYDQMERDLQDVYFDEEEANDGEGQEETGELDY